MRRILSIGFTALVVALAGCGSGGGSAPSTPAAVTPAGPSTSTANRTTATATATIVIPKRSSSSAQRSALYISPSTQSISFLATRTSDKWAEGSYDLLTPSSSNCTTVTAGLQCTVPFSAPPTTGSDTDTIAVYLYDGTDEYNEFYNTFPLATGTNVASVTLGAANPISLVLNAIVGELPELGTPSTIVPSVPGSVSIPLILQDYGSNAIGAGIGLDSPVTVTLSDTTAFSLVTPAAGTPATTGSLTSSVADIVLHYNGSTAAHMTTLTLTTTSMDSFGINNDANFTTSIVLPY